MKKMTLSLVILLIILSGYTSFRIKQVNETVSYPEGYRNWTHISSSVIGPGSPAFTRFGGIHHIYGNDKAISGFKTGNFPDGAMFVFDLLETVEQQGNISGGTRKFIDVMEKDSKKFSSTGGWGYQEFKGNTREINIDKLEQQKCANCHMKQKEKDFVFSTF